jgi:hypothetical protein
MTRASIAPSFATSTSSTFLTAARRAAASLRFATLAAVIATTSLTGCVAVEEEPEAQPATVKRMFASAQTVTGSLGGLTGADAQCASWASAANLGGTWKAFLSTATVDAPSRIAEAGPWYNVTRQYLMFNNKTGFTVGPINPIRTEYNTVASGNAWTGTKANGTADAVHCSNWTTSGATFYASVGTPNSTLNDGAIWMAKGGNAPVCGSSLRVYCFEQ